MRKKGVKIEQVDYSDNIKKKSADFEDFNEKSMKKTFEEYKCGKEECGKYYHSYTAFYNHCKKSHEGLFPPKSLYNGKTFEGPSKNRGRPRIKKTDAKDLVQIESLKTENELIEFLGDQLVIEGTLPKKKKNQELIVYVSNPIDQLEEAIDIVSAWTSTYDEYLQSLKQLNKVITENDLPDFYDPIEIEKYLQKVDSYNFNSIYKFLTDQSKGLDKKYGSSTLSLMRKILIIWLTRILNERLLAEIIYSMAQIDSECETIKQNDYLVGRSGKLKSLTQKYFQCLIAEQSNKLDVKGISVNSNDSC